MLDGNKVKTEIKHVALDDGTDADVKFSNYSDCFESDALKEKLTFFEWLSLEYHRTVRKIKDLYYRIKYSFQRMFKGYDDVDTFELFANFTDHYTKILTDFRNNHYGYPCDLTESQWDEILDEMLYHLDYMSEERVKSKLRSNMPEDWLPDGMVVYEIMEKHKDEFFKLFSKYFYNLWD